MPVLKLSLTSQGQKMKVSLQQGSAEWLAVRRTRVTASDASCLMGVNPWTTAYQCWQRKLGLIPDIVENDDMKRGLAEEANARARFIELTGIYVEPAVVFHGEQFMASLDGYNEHAKLICEIKCPRFKGHQQAQQRVIPDHYRVQIAHQFLCCPEVEYAYYCSYYEGDLVMTAMGRDEDLISQVYHAGLKFYDCIINKTPPPLTDKDVINVEVSDDLKTLCDKWKYLNFQIKSMEKELDSVKKELTKLESSGNMLLVNQGKPLLRLSKVNRQGNVDMERLCKDKEISTNELDTYRKQPSSFLKITDPNHQEEAPF